MLNALELYRGYQDSASERDNRRALAELAQRKFASEQQMMPGQLEGQRLSNLGKMAQMRNQEIELQQNEMFKRAQLQNQADNVRRQEAQQRALEQFQMKSLESRERVAAMRAAQAAQAGNKAPPGFRFTANGDLERIPGGPADLKAEAELQKKAAGSGEVDVSLGALRDAYNRLEKGGGITSTQNSALGNVIPSLSSSAAGQVAGKVFGTNNQSARNDIAMARPALLAALMKATGMSAKQMDSNAELKLWLSTATDPTLDIESNRRALDNIEKKYLMNSGSSDSANKSAATPGMERGRQPATAAPKVGAMEGGFWFKGGNPADPKNWEKVK